MQKLIRTGVGTATVDHDVYDSTGTGMLPIQADGDGATTFRLLGRVASDAPWVEIIAPGTADFLQSFAWVPYIQLEVTAGAGTVSVWIGEK